MIIDNYIIHYSLLIISLYLYVQCIGWLV